MFRYEALQAEQAGVPVEVGTDLALFIVGHENAIHAPRQKPGEAVLAEVQGQSPNVVATVDHDVESIELHLVIVSPAMKAVEVRDPVDAEQDRLTIQDKGGRPDAKGRRGDQRIFIAPIMPVSGPQPDPLAVALDDQTIAVVLDFVNPVCASRNFSSPGWDAWFEGTGTHGAEIGEAEENASLPKRYPGCYPGPDSASGRRPKFLKLLAPRAGFEPATIRLTVARLAISRHFIRLQTIGLFGLKVQIIIDSIDFPGIWP